MTLSRALRYKKRVIETIRKLEQEITAYNSVAVEEAGKFDVKAAFEARLKTIEHLLALKLATIEATKPIQDTILRMAEEKSTAAFLARLNTTDGWVRPRYQGEADLTYVSAINREEKERLIKECQDKIDAFQTEIDAFNARTEIVVPDL